MATKHKLTVSTRPPTGRSTSAERRAAQIEALATQQTELKQQAAERRAARAKQSAPAPASPRGPVAARRSDAR